MAQRFSITLTQLSYFTECAKTLNMTEASQTLHVAQSAVSTAISHLEKALDASLFIRQHAKGLVLTPAGAQLLSDTQQLFGMLSESIETIRSDHHEVRGSISVACFKTLTPFLLPPLIDRLQSQHPELEVEYIEGDHEEILSALRSGRAEIAIAYRFADADGISVEPVGTVPPHVILAADHPLATRESIALSELGDEPLVLLDLPESRDYFLGLIRQGGLSADPKYRTSNYETVRSMVSMGLGYSILNQRPSTNTSYTGGNLATIEISDHLPPLELTVLTLSQVNTSARARAVAATARELMTRPRS